LAINGEFLQAWSLSASFEGAADSAFIAGHPEAAARLLGAAEAMRHQAGMVIDAFAIAEHEALLARTREALGAATFAATWRQGESMTLEDAIAEADAVLADAAQS
jgi:hypothetical protein